MRESVTSPCVVTSGLCLNMMSSGHQSVSSDVRRIRSDLSCEHFRDTAEPRTAWRVHPTFNC